jgi:hypothetical protein
MRRRAPSPSDNIGHLVSVLTCGDIVRADLLRRERDTLRERFLVKTPNAVSQLSSVTKAPSEMQMVGTETLLP